MRAQGTRTSLPVWPPLQALAAVLGGEVVPEPGLERPPNVGTGIGTGMWMRMVMCVGIRVRMGTGMGQGMRPPPSLQVAKAREGFVGTPRDFGDGVVEGQVRGSPLNLPPSSLVSPGTVFPPGHLLAPVVLLS